MLCYYYVDRGWWRYFLTIMRESMKVTTPPLYLLH